MTHLLRLNTIQSPNTTVGKLTCNTPLSGKGGARSKRDCKIKKKERVYRSLAEACNCIELKSISPPHVNDLIQLASKLVLFRIQQPLLANTAR
ncbi:hypothetical protein MTR_5g093965 [Medicago truncatula]|uniref:Uncharacterized protein n=1 Tax=Medicago truncatula TaxID=3880 RepID=A0A072URF0_MEDTR|nr:hypothetical protein MTR_5g093965 [Medicago truncatula]